LRWGAQRRHGLTHSAQLYDAVYLLSHGDVKVVLVVALLRNKLWAYPWLIAFLAIFVSTSSTASPCTHRRLIALTAFDPTSAKLVRKFQVR
jgi:uncharacterized membrane protein